MLFFCYLTDEKAEQASMLPRLLSFATCAGFFFFFSNKPCDCSCVWFNDNFIFHLMSTAQIVLLPTIKLSKEKKKQIFYCYIYHHKV